MKYAHIINYFNSQPWAILPDKLHAMISLIELRAAGFTLTDNEIEARIGTDKLEAATSQGIAPSSIAVIPVMGVISNRMGLLSRTSGGITIDSFREEFKAALHNPEVAAIVLDIDSPGGATPGVEEAAADIYAARKEKRIVASVNSLCGSAAYWLASAAHEIALTPSGSAGAIGILGVHMDLSEQAKQQGVTVTVLSAGKYKAANSEFTPLSTEVRDRLQRLIDERHDAFVRDVARGRGVSQKKVREGFGEGLILSAPDALSEHMVDSIETMDQVLARISGRAKRARKIAEAVSWNFESEGAVVGATAQAIKDQELGGFKAQMIVAPKDQWNSLDAARAAAKEQGFRADRVEDTAKAWNFYQRDPADFNEIRTKPMEGCNLLIVGGRLKDGIAAVFHDPEAEGVDEFLNNAVVPGDVAEEIAPDGTTWEKPALKDFTSKSWEELTDQEKRRIAMHAAWAKAMPPENFGDVKLFHHRPSDGAIVPNGVRNALARLNQTEGLGNEKGRVEAHLRRHMDAIQKRRESARANPDLDPDRAALELMELG